MAALALLAVAADNESVRFVPQALQIVQNRAFGIETEGSFSGR